MNSNRSLVWLLLVALICLDGAGWAVSKKKLPDKKKKPKEKEVVTKIISQKDFEDAVQKFAQDDRLPVASSTLVEKGRGAAYYAVDKLVDDDPETFWAEGASGPGGNEWVTFVLPIGTTHLDIIPGAGKEQFQNFNRPKEMFLDVYQVKLKRKDEAYKLKAKYIGRTVFEFDDKPQLLRKKLETKLPDVVGADRILYVGVLIIDKVYKGQFDDTALSQINTSIIYGE